MKNIAALETKTAELEHRKPASRINNISAYLRKFPSHNREPFSQLVLTVIHKNLRPTTPEQEKR